MFSIFYVCYYVFADASFSVGTPNLAMSGLICSLSAFWVLSFLVTKKMEKQKALIILVLCVGADIGINKVLQGFQTNSSNIVLHYYAGINLTLLGIAFCAGILLSSIIKKPSYLIPLAAAGFADHDRLAFAETRLELFHPSGQRRTDTRVGQGEYVLRQQQTRAIRPRPTQHLQPAIDDVKVHHLEFFKPLPIKSRSR